MQTLQLKNFVKIRKQPNAWYVSFRYQHRFWSAPMLCVVGFGLLATSIALHPRHFTLIEYFKPDVLVLLVVGTLCVCEGGRLWWGVRAWVVSPGHVRLIYRMRREKIVYVRDLVRLEWNEVACTEDSSANQTKIFDIVAVLKNSRNITVLGGIPEYLYADICHILLTGLAAEHLLALSGAMKSRDVR